MTSPAGALRHRATRERPVPVEDGLSKRGEYRAVAGLTRVAAGYRTINLKPGVLGNQPVSDAEGEVVIRNSALARSVTRADVCVLDGQRYQILAVDHVDPSGAVVRFQVKRASR